MAIIIPSKNIYNKDNDKVRDNVVDRIEVSAVAVLPSNEYETPVYNLSNNDDFEQRANVVDFESSSSSAGQGTYTHTLGASYLSLQPQFANFKLIIPKVKDNKLIEKILYQDNKIGVSIFLKKYTGTGTGFAQRTNYINPTSISNLQYQISEITETTSMDDPILTYENTVGVLPSSVPLLNEINSDVISDTLNSPIYKEDENNFYLEFNVFVGYEQYKLLGANSFPSANASFASADVNLSGEWVKYVPQKVEITIYGNTIGIDLNDNPIYVPDVSGSKPLSVEGNELMQTQNYIEREVPIKMDIFGTIGTSEAERYVYSDGNLLRVGEWVTYNGESANIIGYDDTNGYYLLRVALDGEIYNLTYGTVVNVVTTVNQLNANFMDTLKEYSRGKETATIRCSISDYYDEEGNKVISVDNNVDKMVFDLYDIVIPMVYGANGVDKPLSKYKDGVTKTFKVLGTKIFYDGAVWQELSLQETFIGNSNSSGGGSSGGGSEPEPELPYIISADGIISAREEGSVYGNLYVPYEVVGVADNGFKDCVALVSVTFVNGDALPDIGDGAFSGCYALESIRFNCTYEEFISAYENGFEDGSSWFADLSGDVLFDFYKGTGDVMTKDELLERYGS